MSQRHHVTENDISYYLDQIAKDDLDLGTGQSHWNEWVKLRAKVLKLSFENLKPTLHAVEAILEHALSLESGGRNTPENSRSLSSQKKAAQKLFDSSQGVGPKPDR